MKTRAQLRPTQLASTQADATRAPQPLSSRPEHSLPLAEGNAEWRDLVSHANHSCRRMALIFVALLASHSLAGSAHGQSAEAQGTLNPGLTCSPAPCVLPPTQASEGGSTVTDTPIVTNPLNPKQLLLGGVDYNCADPSSLRLPSFPRWRLDLEARRVHARPSKRGGVYWPTFDPHVGYDRKGTGYIVGYYNDSEGEDGFVAVQKSTDGTHWSKPAVALRRAGNTYPFEIGFAVRH